MAYCSTDQVITFFSRYGFPVDQMDPLWLAELIKGAEMSINALTQVDFNMHVDNYEWRDGNSRSTLVLYNWPIKKVSHVVVYNQLLQLMRVFTQEELIIDYKFGELFLPQVYPVYLSDEPYRGLFGNVFVKGKRNIEILYDYGYDEAPEDIQRACLLRVGIDLLNANLMKSSGGANSRSFDGLSESFGNIHKQIQESWKSEYETIIAQRKKLFARAI